MMEIALPTLLGLLASALINYLSDVLPRSRRPAQPHCLQCDYLLSWGGYLKNEACPQCKTRPWSWRHLVVAIVATGLYLRFWFVPSADLIPSAGAVGWARLLSWLLLLVFGVIFVIDMEYRVVLDQVSLASGLLFGAMGMWLHGWRTTLIGAAGGFLMMYGLYALGELYVRLKNKRGASLSEEDVALGFGDVKLATVLGLLLGWPDVLAMLLLALLLGGVFGLLVLIVLIARGKDTAAAAMPYAPYLLVITAYIILW